MAKYSDTARKGTDKGHGVFCALFLWVLVLSGCTPEVQKPSATQIDPTDTKRPQSTPLPTLEDHQETPAPTLDSTLSGSSFSILLMGIEEEPYTSIVESVLFAVEDAVDDVNTQGGISGASLELHYINGSESEESLTRQFVNAVRDTEPLIVLMAVPVDEDFYREIQRIRIPVLYFGFGAADLDLPNPGRDYLFWLTPVPDEQFAFFLQQSWKHWEQIRPPGTMNEFKIGYLTWEDPPFPIAITPGISQFYQNNQFEFMLESNIPMSANTSTVNFLLQCITYGITVVYTDTFAFGPAVLQNDIHSLGLKDFFVVGGSIWAYDQVHAQYLLSPGAAENLVLPLPVTWWSETDAPSIGRAKQIAGQAGRTDMNENLAYLLGLGAVDVAVHVIRESSASRQGSQVSASDVYLQLDGLDNYPVLDGLYQLDYADGGRSPIMLRLWSVSPDQIWTPIGDSAEVPNLSNGDKTP